jgi:murein DD-endopeptidase MepM/ murein hydrolase activator NlpD
MKPQTCFLLIWLITVVSACNNTPDKTHQLASISLPNVQQDTIIPADNSPTPPDITLPPDNLPTPPLITDTVPTPEETDTPIALPTPLQDDLSLFFPAQSSIINLRWRPPLYPTPWVPTPYDHFYFARPIAAIDLKWVLPNYRYGGVFFKGVVHTGIDIDVKEGTEIYAAGPGRINWAGYGLMSGVYNPDDPYGMAVVIRHDFGYQEQTLYTVYGHMSRIDVVQGQQVNTGDLLGLSGETGHVTGPHLHFEVRIGKNSLSRSRNPELWLSPPQGWGVLAGRVLDALREPLISKQLYIRSVETGRKWSVMSYGKGTVTSDPYYRENLVIGDLPAGHYIIWMPLESSKYEEVQILPGRVSYFTFNKGIGFNTNPPPTPWTGFATPQPPETTTP